MRRNVEHLYYIKNTTAHMYIQMREGVEGEKKKGGRGRNEDGGSGRNHLKIIESTSREHFTAHGGSCWRTEVAAGETTSRRTEVAAGVRAIGRGAASTLRLLRHHDVL